MNLNNLKKKLISEDELKHILGNIKYKFLVYSDIDNYKNINDLFEDNKYKYVVILYLIQNSNTGHLTLLINHGSYYEFFDSIGLKLDNELSFVDDKDKNKYNQDYPHLTKLLYNSKKKVEYNDMKLQKLDPNINTCARWVAVRILLGKLPLKKFQKIFKNLQKKYDLDELVVYLTEF